MITAYEVATADGRVQRYTDLDEVRAILQTDPGAVVRPTVRYRSCPTHSAYKSENCPGCGTGVSLG